MRYEAHLSAYDVMNYVYVGVSVNRQEDPPSGVQEQALHLTATVAGVGETDVREWLRDALVTMLEAL